MKAAAEASLPAAVWQAWLAPRQVVTVQPVGGGFSGARVYRCSPAAGSPAWSLRCWPSGTTAQRVAEIHQVIGHACREGCELIPRQQQTSQGQTLTSVQGHCWELAQWRAGQPFGGGGQGQDEAGAEAAVESAAAAVALFHSAVVDLAQRQEVAPAIADRLTRIDRLDPWFRQPPQPPRHWPGWLAEACRVAGRSWAAGLPPLKTELIAESTLRRPLQYVLRDVHRDHVLFQDQRVVALIDFDALRVDSPATDLARLVSSFAGETGPSPAGDGDRCWRAAVAGYRRIRPFSEQDFRLARLLARVSPLISLANWVIWVGVEQRDFDAGEARVAARVEQLTRLVRITFGVS